MAASTSKMEEQDKRRIVFFDFNGDDRFDFLENTFEFSLDLEHGHSTKQNTELMRKIFANEDACNCLTKLLTMKRCHKMICSDGSEYECIDILPVNEVMSNKLNVVPLIRKDTGNKGNLSRVISIDDISFQNNVVFVKIKNEYQERKIFVAFTLVAIKTFCENIDFFDHNINCTSSKFSLDVVLSERNYNNSRNRRQDMVFSILSGYKKYISEKKNPSQQSKPIARGHPRPSTKSSSSDSDEDQLRWNNYETIKSLLIEQGVTFGSIEKIRLCINSSNYELMTKDCINMKYIKSLRNVERPAENIYLCKGTFY